jgi:hypothetical protein
MDWDKINKQYAASSREREKDELLKSVRSSRSMTLSQRKLIYALCDERNLPRPSGMSVYDASIEISRLKACRE